VMLTACGGTAPLPPNLPTPTATLHATEAPTEDKTEIAPDPQVEELNPVIPAVPVRRDLLSPSSPRIQ
jgi:hypothetical protein